MFEIIVYYVLPNVLLFGTIYALGKMIENSTEDYVQNHEQYEKQLLDIKRKLT